MNLGVCRVTAKAYSSPGATFIAAHPLLRAGMCGLTTSPPHAGCVAVATPEVKQNRLTYRVMLFA
jgi:hypothetical protein